MIDKNPHCCFNLHSFLVRLMYFHIFKGHAYFFFSDLTVCDPFVISYCAKLHAVRILTIYLSHVLYVFCQICNLFFNVFMYPSKQSFYSQIHYSFLIFNLFVKKDLLIQDYKYIFIYALLLILYGIFNLFQIYFYKYI